MRPEFVRLSDDVRQQLALDLGDLVFEKQLSLFQPPQLELIDRRALGKERDSVVEFAVLGFQSDELYPQSFYVKIHGRCQAISR
jgi:hypothetical protein